MNSRHSSLMVVGVGDVVVDVLVVVGLFVVVVSPGLGLSPQST